MNTEKLQQIDELLTQIAEDIVALASDVTKLKAKREQIELQLQSVAETQAQKEFFPKLYNYGIFTNGQSKELDAGWKDFIKSEKAQYMTRATPELAEHDAIALHNYARLLAYRAEHWPEFVQEIAALAQENVPYEAELRTNKIVIVTNHRSADRFPVFPAKAKDQLQQALDNGLLVPYKQTS